MCYVLWLVLSLDAMDVSGEQQIDVVNHMMKQRLGQDGKPVEAIPEKGSMCLVILKPPHKSKLL